jgi:hypothetical protein
VRLTNPSLSFSPKQTTAQQDGRVLLDHLKKVLAEFDRLESQARPILESTSGQPQPLSNEVKMLANSLVIVTSDLRDFVESLKPPSTGEQGGGTDDGDEDDENLTVDAVRRRFEEQSGSMMDSVKAGLSSILPMLDPPLHTSIFGFDVQRGCMLSRYRGARQFWVQRPGGGMIDVLHIPAKSNGPPPPRNHKAVMYCNPNAGLIEVATGMSLAGGNVASDAEGVVNDNCWSDMYTNLGYDMYLFNYAGFGRSYGAGYCGIGRRGGDEPYVDGAFGRIQRILHGTFCSFQVSRVECTCSVARQGLYSDPSFNSQLRLHCVLTAWPSVPTWCLNWALTPWSSTGRVLVG